FAGDGSRHRPRSCYQRACIIGSDQAAPYLRLFVVSVLLEDPTQAGVYLRQGLRRVHTRDDLNISATECVPSVENFKKIQTSVGQDLLSMSAGATEHVIMAFLSWVLGDLDVARREAQLAAQLAPDRPDIVRFAQLVQGDGAAGAAH